MQPQFCDFIFSSRRIIGIVEIVEVVMELPRAGVWAGMRPSAGFGDDAADALRYLVATRSRTIVERKLRGCRDFGFTICDLRTAELSDAGGQ